MPLARQLFRFGISGSIGLILGFGLYEAAYRLLPDVGLRPTLAWVASYAVGIAFQHSLHRWLVFRSPVSYWASLWRTYLVYSIGSIVAAGLNLSLNSVTDLNHRIVWLVTTCVVSVLNFAALKLFAFAPRGE